MGLYLSLSNSHLRKIHSLEFGLSTASRWSKFIRVHPESQINSKKYSHVTVVCIVGYRIYSWHSSDFYVFRFELWPTPQEFETNLACQKWDWAGNLTLFFTSYSLDMEQFEALQMYLKIPTHIQEIDLALGCFFHHILTCRNIPLSTFLFGLPETNS